MHLYLEYTTLFAWLYINVKFGPRMFILVSALHNTTRLSDLLMHILLLIYYKGEKNFLVS